MRSNLSVNTQNTSTIQNGSEVLNNMNGLNSPTLQSNIIIHDSENNILYKNINIEDGKVKSKVQLNNTYTPKLSNFGLNKFFKFRKDSQIIYQNYLSGSSSTIAFYLNFDVNSSDKILSNDYICSFYFNDNGDKICSIQVIRDTSISSPTFKFKLKLHSLKKSEDNKYSLDASSTSQYGEFVHPTPFLVNDNHNLFLMIFKLEKSASTDGDNNLKFIYYNASDAKLDEDSEKFLNIPITQKKKTLFESFNDLLKVELSDNLSLSEATGVSFILGSPISNTETAKLTALMKIGNIKKYLTTIDNIKIIEDFKFDKIKVHCSTSTKIVIFRDPDAPTEKVEIPSMVL
jgi:hypothetical protein